MFANSATRASARVALATCAELDQLEADDRLVIAPLAEVGISAVPAVWDDPDTDWSGFDLTVLRSPWDYPARRDEFVAWAHTVPALANPPDIVEWNTDKRYLAGFGAAGLPVVPTGWVETAGSWIPPDTGEWVIKPAVSAGSKDTGRYDLTRADHRERASAHVARLCAAGRRVMVQPYLPAVDHHGETALLFIGGRYSHAIRKGPMLTGPDQGSTELYQAEEITSRQPSTAEFAVAERVLARVPGGAGRLLYARVDLIPGPDGDPLLIELELTEPSLFLGWAEGAAGRFAAAIAAYLDSRAGQPA